MSKKKVAVIIAEGDTDFIFYKNLLKHITDQNGRPKSRIDIINIKGIGKFASKVPAKFKNETKIKYPGFEYNIFLGYDSDVFEFKTKPPIDWAIVEEKLKTEGADSVHHLKAVKMIEDWFVYDTEGICKNLNVKVPNKLKGKTGLERVQFIFKLANRIYQKGYNSNNFINCLDLGKIYPKIKTIIYPLESEMYK